MKRTVLITRPEEDALPLAETLRARDLRVLIEPMLRIKPIRDVKIDLEGVQALLFSSSNGVRAFAALNKNRDLPVFTTGEASARVARNLGFKTVEAADGDVNGLVRLVRHRVKPEDGALFHGAGSVVAGDLALQLTSLGYNLRREVLYEAVQADELSAPLLQKFDADEIDIVLLFSPRTVETFLGLLKSSGKLDKLAGVTALCMSRAVADAANRATWRAVEAAEQPDLNAMLSLIERTTSSLDAEPEIPGTVAAAPAATVSASKPRPTIDMAAPVNAPPPLPRRSGRWVWISAVAIALFVLLAGLATMPAWRSLFGDGRDGGVVDVAIPPAEETATQTAEAEQPAADEGASDTTSAASDAAATTDESATEESTASEATTDGTATTETAPAASDETAADEPAADAADTTVEPAADDAAATSENVATETGGSTDTQQDNAPADAASGSETETATGTNASGTGETAETTAQPASATPAGDPRVEDLLARLAAIEDAVKATGAEGGDASSESLTAIEERLAALEQGGPSSAGADEIAVLTERVAAIEQLLIDFMTEVPAESLADVKAEVQRLIDENAGLRDQLATLTTRFEQADSTAFMLAVGRLGTALNEGRPFEPELATLQKLAAKDPALAAAKPALDALAQYAATGAPGEIALAARFPEVARAIVQAAQQEGVGAATEEAGWWDRLMGRISELVTVRPVGENVEGNSAAARVARAEARIAVGDLASAVNELDQLTGAAADAAATWLEAAKARLAVKPAFQSLDALALDRLGTGAGAATGG